MYVNAKLILSGVAVTINERLILTLRFYARQSYDVRIRMDEVVARLRGVVPSLIVTPFEDKTLFELCDDEDGDTKRGLVLTKKSGVAHRIVMERKICVSARGKDKIPTPLTLIEDSMPNEFSVIEYVQTPISGIGVR